MPVGAGGFRSVGPDRMPTMSLSTHCPAPSARALPVEDARVPTTLPAASRGTLTCDLALRHAGVQRVAIRWERMGRSGGPVVVVAGGISAHRHVAANACDADAGWWPAQVGSGRAVDTDAFEVIGIDWLGADGTLDVVIDPGDQADAIVAVLDALRIGCVDAFVGASYGAMVGLQFAARHPSRLSRLVAISGTHRANPYASAFRALQRRAVALGALQCDAAHGVALARQLALLSYRTPDEFDARFGPAVVEQGRVRVGAETYLDHCGAAFAQRTSATAYLRLSESIDLQQVEPSRIRTPVTVVAVAEDRLVPIGDAYLLAHQLGGETRVRVLRSRYGHDAFLKEPVALADILGEALAVHRAVAA